MNYARRFRGSRVRVAAVAALLIQCSAPAGPVGADLEELVPGFAYDGWFTDLTGLPLNPDGFGAYALEPAGGTLYLGFGADVPAVLDGALLAAFDDSGLRGVAPLTEQGVNDMTVAGDTLLVPGVDPCCPDGWDSGNFYRYHPATGLIKLRNLPNVLHGWGVWHEAGTGEIYLAASAHPGDFLTSLGQVWRSGDGGRGWELVADSSDGVGSYRTYDVIGHAGGLVVVSRNEDCSLAVRPAGASGWTDPFPGSRVACAHRLAEFGEALIALDSNRAAIHVLSPAGATAGVALPFSVGADSYNWAVQGGGAVYAIADDGRVLTTRDLIAWQTIARSARPFGAIQYWPEKDWLVLAQHGAGGRVWKIRLCHAAPC